MSSTTMTQAMSYQAAGTAFNAIVGFALMIALGRLLAPATFAQYVTLLSMMAVAMILIGGGNSNWLYRAGVANRGTVARDALGNAVAQATIATCVFAATALIWRDGNMVLAMLCAGALVLADFVSMSLRANDAFAKEAMWQAALRLASALAIVFGVLWFGPDIGVIYFAWFLATSLMLVLAARRRLALPQAGGLRGHFLRVTPIIVVDALLALLVKGDVAVLSVRIASADLSGYAVDSRFIEAAILAFSPVCNVQMRHLGMKLSAPDLFAKAWQRAAGAGFALGLVSLMASLLAGEWTVRLLFGAAYVEAGRLLPWVALSLPMLLANLVLAQAMLSAGREKILVGTLVFGALAWLIGLMAAARIGLRGACVGAAIGHACVTVATVASLLEYRRRT